MLRCNSGGKLLPPKQLTKGDAVQLLTGPFANYIAKVETIDAEQRVWVLMELMGQITRDLSGLQSIANRKIIHTSVI